MNAVEDIVRESPRPRLDWLQLVGEELERCREDCRRQTARRKREEAEGKSPSGVLDSLLPCFSRVDFRGQSGLEEGEKLRQKDIVYFAVEEVMAKAVENDWGLCTRNETVYIYNGKRWCPVSRGRFKSFLTEALARMGAKPSEARHYAMQDELYKQFVSVSDLPVLESMEGETLVNLSNGTMEFAGGIPRMREHRREDFLTYVLPFGYDPQAVCPLFDRYLGRVLPDEGCRDLLAEYLGYVFTKGMKLEKVLLLYGSGANGKSVLFDIINALLGKENVCSHPLSALTRPDSYERPELQDKLLNYSPEINGKLESSIFKQLASGEPVSARRPYERPFTMEGYAKLMFNCNELPRETEQTHAFFRRFLIIPFNVTIPEGEQDPELSRKIISAELPGIFNWVLAGLGRLTKRGKFLQPEAVRQELERFRRESDSVAMFTGDSGLVPGGDRIPFADLYRDYKAYCNDYGFSPCSAKTFSQRLESSGYRKGRDMRGMFLFVSRIHQADCM